MGFSVVTTVLSKAASYDLADLATVKAELSINPTDTSNDDWLGGAIGRISAMIASQTERVFAPEVVQDALDIQQDAYPYETPGGFAELQLTRWPVLGVVSVGQVTGLNSTRPLTEGVDFRVDPASGQLLRLCPATGAAILWEALPVIVQYVAGYGALEAETGVVAAPVPHQVTVSRSRTFSCDQSVSYAGGAMLARVRVDPAAGQYSVARGVYTFAAADAGKQLAFAYATLDVPDDLVDVTLQLVTARFRSRGRDPALIQRETPGIGIERFWFGGAPGQTGRFPPAIEAILDGYSVPMVA